MASASNFCALLLASAIPDELIINVQSTKYHVLSILKLKVGFQNVLAELQYSSIDDRCSTLVFSPYFACLPQAGISYLTFDYLSGTLYNLNPYLVLRTWYIVLGT